MVLVALDQLERRTLTTIRRVKNCVSSGLILEGQRKEVKGANYINPSSLLEKDFWQ